MLDNLYISFICFFVKHKTAYEMRISDWSSDVCSSYLLYAVDRFLQRRGHGFGDHLRVGARVHGAHHHRWRHHVRVFADRQQRDRDQAGGEDHDRQHRGEDRPVDEESGKVHGRFLARPSGARRWGRGARPRAWRRWVSGTSKAMHDPPRGRGGTGRIGGIRAAAGASRRGEGASTLRSAYGRALPRLASAGSVTVTDYLESGQAAPTAVVCR